MPEGEIDPTPLTSTVITLKYTTSDNLVLLELRSECNFVVSFLRNVPATSDKSVLLELRNECKVVFLFCVTSQQPAITWCCWS